MSRTATKTKNEERPGFRATSKMPARRAELGLSQKELAEKVGTTQSHISEIENGRVMRTSMGAKIVSALGYRKVADALEGKVIKHARY